MLFFSFSVAWGSESGLGGGEGEGARGKGAEFDPIGAPDKLDALFSPLNWAGGRQIFRPLMGLSLPGPRGQNRSLLFLGCKLLTRGGLGNKGPLALLPGARWCRPSPWVWVFTVQSPHRYCLMTEDCCRVLPGAAGAGAAPACHRVYRPGCPSPLGQAEGAAGCACAEAACGAGSWHRPSRALLRAGQEGAGQKQGPAGAPGLPEPEPGPGHLAEDAAPGPPPQLPSKGRCRCEDPRSQNPFLFLCLRPPQPDVLLLCLQVKMENVSNLCLQQETHPDLFALCLQFRMSPFVYMWKVGRWGRRAGQRGPADSSPGPPGGSFQGDSRFYLTDWCQIPPARTLS